VVILQWILLWEPAPETLERAYTHARLAVDLDEHLPYAHWAVCWTQLWRKQSEASIAAGRRAIALDPNNADAYHVLALSFAAAGRGEESLHCIEKAMRLNPHPTPFFQLALGTCYYVLNEYDRAIAAFRRGVEINAAFIPNYHYLCLMYTALGRHDEAGAERERLMQLTGGRTPVTQDLWIDKQLLEHWQALNRVAGIAG
jgi:adenylate cyclase